MQPVQVVARQRQMVHFGARGVAQPGSAPEWGSGGRTFESSRPDHHPDDSHSTVARKLGLCRVSPSSIGLGASHFLARSIDRGFRRDIGQRLHYLAFRGEYITVLGGALRVVPRVHAKVGAALHSGERRKRDDLSIAARSPSRAARLRIALSITVPGATAVARRHADLRVRVRPRGEGVTPCSCRRTPAYRSLLTSQLC